MERGDNKRTSVQSGTQAQKASKKLKASSKAAPSNITAKNEKPKKTINITGDQKPPRDTAWIVELVSWIIQASMLMTYALKIKGAKASTDDECKEAHTSAWESVTEPQFMLFLRRRFQWLFAIISSQVLRIPCWLYVSWSRLVGQ